MVLIIDTAITNLLQIIEIEKPLIISDYGLLEFNLNLQ